MRGMMSGIQAVLANVLDKLALNHSFHDGIEKN